MTNNEFQDWLAAEFAKYPLLNKSNPKSVNELVYVLRMSGKDFTLNETDENGGFSFVPTVRDAFMPTRFLAKKVVGIEYEEDEEAEIPLVIIRTKEAS